MSAHMITEVPGSKGISSELLGTLHPIFRTEAFKFFMRDPYLNANLQPLQLELQKCSEDDMQAIMLHIDQLPNESFSTAHRGIFRSVVYSCLHPHDGKPQSTLQIG